MAHRVDGSSTSLDHDVPVASLRLGDVVRVRPGERVPSDGVVVHFPTSDGGVDAGLDGGADASVDAGPDAKLDAATDAKKGNGEILSGRACTCDAVGTPSYTRGIGQIFWLITLLGLALRAARKRSSR